MIQSQNLKLQNQFHLLEKCDVCGAIYTVRGEVYPDGVTIEIHDHICAPEPEK